MNQSGTNILFRSALLLFNIALLGSVAAHMHFGFDLRDLLASESESKTKKDLSKKQSSDERDSVADLTGRIAAARESSAEVVRVQGDGSRVTRMEDGYGNSTVTRNFSGHKLLRKVIVRFQAKGQRAAFVYGKNGQVKSLPARYQDRILTASADEIAAAAMIFDAQNPSDHRKQRLNAIKSRLSEQASSEAQSATSTPGPEPMLLDIQESESENPEADPSEPDR